MPSPLPGSEPVLFFRIVNPPCAPGPKDDCKGRDVQIFAQQPDGGLMLVSSGQYKFDKLVGVDIYGQAVGIARVKMFKMPRSGPLAGRKSVTGRWFSGAYDSPTGLLGPASRIPQPRPGPAPAPRPMPGTGAALPTRYRRR